MKGFIALTTVLLISAVALLIGTGISFFSVSEANIALQKSQSSQAYYLANLCSEHALMELKEDSNYSGAETINTEAGVCEILPIEGNWTIKVFGSSADQIKKMKIIISQIDPEIIISSWLEVADF